MRKYSVTASEACLVIAVCFLSITCCRPQTAFSSQDWQELGGQHFIVYYTGEDKFARSVSEESERYYNNIADDLGYSRYGGFWLWDKRVKIYLYLDRAAYLQATNQPEWSEGMADYKLKQIHGFLGSKQFLESVLPHEIAHLIFRDFVGFKGEVPIWLDEGVAQREEEAKRQELKAMAKKRFNENTFLSMSDMMRLDLNNITHLDRIYIRVNRLKNDNKSLLFLSGDNLIASYYLQSVSIVSFLIDRYGSDNFAHFCRELRDGKQIEEALSFAYPSSIRSLSELEDKWREYLGKQ